MTARRTKSLSGANWDKLDVERGKSIPPADSFSALEFLTRYALSRNQARRMLDALVEKGKIKCIGTFGPKSAKRYVII